MRPEEEGSPQERETLLSGREIWPGPPEGIQKGSPNSPVAGDASFARGTELSGAKQYVWIFICPDGSTLQHPAAPLRKHGRRWTEFARNVLAFAVKVVL